MLALIWRKRIFLDGIQILFWFKVVGGKSSVVVLVSSDRNFHDQGASHFGNDFDCGRVINILIVRIIMTFKK